MRSRFRIAPEESPVKKDKFLDVDASMQGTLSFNDPVNLRINGKFEGKLNTRGTLMIGENADVTAEIVGESVTIAGRVNGNIKASRELKVISPAAISGNIDTPVLSVAEGATINGDIKMSGAQSQQTLFSREMLTIDDVAKYLEIDRSLVFEWANNGRLPGTKEGSIWMFERSELDKWVSNEKIN